MNPKSIPPTLISPVLGLSDYRIATPTPNPLGWKIVDDFNRFQPKVLLKFHDFPQVLQEWTCFQKLIEKTPATKILYQNHQNIKIYMIYNIHILNIYKYKYNKTTPLRVGLSTLLGLSQTRGPAHPPNPPPTDHHPTLGSSNQPPSYASWIDPMSMPMLLGSAYRGPRAHLRPHGASRLPYVGCPNKKGQQVVPYSPELQEEFHL